MGYTLYQMKVKAYCTGLKTALKSILAGIGMSKFTRQAKNIPFRVVRNRFRDRKNWIAVSRQEKQACRFATGKTGFPTPTTEGGLHDAEKPCFSAHNRRCSCFVLIGTIEQNWSVLDNFFEFFLWKWQKHLKFNRVIEKKIELENLRNLKISMSKIKKRSRDNYQFKKNVQSPDWILKVSALFGGKFQKNRLSLFNFVHSLNVTEN